MLLDITGEEKAQLL